MITSYQKDMRGPLEKVDGKFRDPCMFTCLTLISFFCYNISKIMRIAIDVDEVLADFANPIDQLVRIRLAKKAALNLKRK